MNDVVIRLEGVGKRYRLGGNTEKYKTIRDSLTHAMGKAGRAVNWSTRPTVGEASARSADFWALRDVSFDVKRGECLAIIGRNGAGKSTLLKLLSQVTEPTEGRIRRKGRVASLLEVGVGFHPELTGRENISLSGSILGMSRAEILRKFDEIVAFAEVEAFVDTPVKHYSSGMYLRLAFAVAAHLEPEILLVDEVLAVGDAVFQRKCLEKMGDVSREGRTVLFVTHNMSAAMALCERGLVLDHGRVVMQGPVADAVAVYAAQGADSSGSTDLLHHPGNSSDILRFDQLSIHQEGEQPFGVVTTDREIEARVSYQILRPVQGIEVSIAVELADGQYLLSTTDVDTTLDLDRPRFPGRYVARCYLPPSFFRAGRYYLTCGASRPNVEQLALMRQVLGFDVLDPNGPETQLGHRRVGLLAPRLSWRTDSSLEAENAAKGEVGETPVMSAFA